MGGGGIANGVMAPPQHQPTSVVGTRNPSLTMSSVTNPGIHTVGGFASNNLGGNSNTNSNRIIVPGFANPMIAQQLQEINNDNFNNSSSNNCSNRNHSSSRTTHLWHVYYDTFGKEIKVRTFNNLPNSFVHLLSIRYILYHDLSSSSSFVPTLFAIATIK
jgi:hypothetical protein